MEYTANIDQVVRPGFPDIHGASVHDFLDEFHIPPSLFAYVLCLVGHYDPRRRCSRNAAGIDVINLVLDSQDGTEEEMMLRV